MGLWAILGAVVAALRPANAVGWLFLAVGLWLAIGLAAHLELASTSEPAPH